MKKTGPTSPAKIAEALAKAEAGEKAQRRAEEESSRIRAGFEKERAALAKRYGPARME
jgi:hypothetical protein